MTADYVILRLDNGYVLSDEDGEVFFERLHDLLTDIKNKESEFTSIRSLGRPQNGIA